MAVENKEVQDMLTGEFDKAQERLQSSKTAIGIADAPQHELFGFAPRAIRIKGKLIAEAELAELTQQQKFVMEDFIRSSKIVDANEQNRANIELNKEMGAARDKIVRAGLKLDAELARAKMSQETTNMIIATLGKGLAAAGKAWAIGKLADAPLDDSAVGKTRSISPGPRQFEAGETMHGMGFADYQRSIRNQSQFNIPDIPSMY